MVDDLQFAINTVRQLRSRGVTRFLDLNQVNKRQLDDVEDDEQFDDMNGDLEESDHEMSPPLRRPRLMLEPPSEPRDAVPLNESQLNPGADESHPQVRESLETMDRPDDRPLQPLEENPGVIEFPDEFPYSPDVSPTAAPVPEPGSEPDPSRSRDISRQVSPQMNQTNQMNQLDPQTLALYQPAGPEDFQTMRRRFAQQETLSLGWGPLRRPRDQVPAEPYVLPTAPVPSDDEGLYAQSFEIENLDTMCLPRGWRCDEVGYLQLDAEPRDYWEVRAGCLIRHHVTPRRNKLSLNNLPKDVPVPRENLDEVRVTAVKQSNGKFLLSTDAGVDTHPPRDCDRAWTGITVFQINGPTRKEMAMYTGHEPVQGARQTAKDYKLQQARKFKKDKNNVSERNLGPDDRAQFMAAKVKELKSFFDNHVWEFQTTREAQPERTMTSRILLNWKKNPDGTPRAKARLIVRGYTDPDAWEGKVVTSSPTTTRLARSILFSLACTLSWKVWTADVSTAFLQGRPQTRKLWVKLPSDCLALLGADESTRMLLLKPCYGQIDAPRGWYLEAVDRLLRKGLRQHPLDPCCFLIYEDPDGQVAAASEESNVTKTGCLGQQNLCGIVIMHVDDMLGAGNMDSKVYNQTIAELKQSFSFREWKEQDLEYCGCALEPRGEFGWKLSHQGYLKKVKPVSYGKHRTAQDPLTEGEVSRLRGLLGSLQWPSVQSSPHLQYSTSLLSGQVNRGSIQTLSDANRLLKFAKENSDVGLVYEFIGDLSQLQLVCFFDAAFATRADGSSQAGYLIMLVNGEILKPGGPEGAYHILDWRSMKTPRIARSSLAAESQAGGQAVDAVEFVCRFWHHLEYPNLPLKNLIEAKSSLVPVMVTDAKALFDSFHREGGCSSVVDRRVSLEVMVLKERLLQLGGSLRWMSSERQFADGLTKESARSLLAQRLRHGRVKMTWDFRMLIIKLIPLGPLSL